MNPGPDLPEFTAACHYLQQARKFGLKLGLQTMERMVEALDHPELGKKFIHIAGTNGKGSTAAFCAAAAGEAGLRVGLYTSPHLCSLRERIQVDRVMISPSDFGAGIRLVRELALRLELQPTFFEILTLLALWYFRKQGVELVIWETGLGGRLDATNIITPTVSVITSIALDHAQYLGETREAIAGEKAGIIKTEIPVVTAVSAPVPRRVIEKVAQEKRAPLTQVGVTWPVVVKSVHMNRVLVSIDHHALTLPLAGAHQASNAACAYAALRKIPVRGKAIPIETLRRGFAKAQWPGRFQILQADPPLILDGAHNIEAIEALLKGWQEVFGETRYHLVFGVLADKPFAEMATMLRRFAMRVSLVGVSSDRSIEPEQLRTCFEGLPLQLFPSLSDFWKKSGVPVEPTLITGSLFLVGQALGLAKPEEYPIEEFALNEKL